MEFGAVCPGLNPPFEPPLRLCGAGNAVNAGEKLHQRAGVKLHQDGMPKAPTGGLLLGDKQDEKRNCLTRDVTKSSSHSLTQPAPIASLLSLEPKLLFLLIQCELLDVVGPVELWATRWRRPSAAANPQGFGWPATPPLTHFVARVMLIRLIDCPSMKIGREQSSLGLVVAQLSCLWLALASLALFEPIAVAVHFEDVDVVGQPVE